MQFRYLLFFVFFMAGLPGVSGQAVIMKGDTLPAESDSLIHLVVRPYRGELQWQRSSNSQEWEDLTHQNRDTLTIPVRRESWYRAKISEGSCGLVYSDTVRVLHYAPVVVTGKVTDVGREEATVAGEVISDGGEPVTERGICTSLSHSPILYDRKFPAGSGTGTFTATLTGLTPDTIWYARAYATNVKGTAYGSEVSFRTLPDATIDPLTVTDIDGNIYSVVRVGEQLWMGQNLRVTRAPDGTPITSTEYDGDSTTTLLYGRYYDWTAAMNGSTAESAQGICPDGWHIPSDEEVKLMEIALGMTRATADISNAWRGYGVGTKIKQGGSSGLDIPMAGMLYAGGSIVYGGEWGFLYTSSEAGNNAWRRCFRTASTGVGRFDTYPKTYGFSVRCIKDK